MYLTKSNGDEFSAELRIHLLNPFCAQKPLLPGTTACLISKDNDA